jgi:hypothetical protein
MKKVNLSRIHPAKKREAWERLQKEYPNQAAWVTDPFVRAMQEDFVIDEKTGETANFGIELIVWLPEENDAKSKAP